MGKGTIRGRRALVFLLTVAMVCSGQWGAAASAAEDTIIEEVDDLEAPAVGQDVSIQTEDIPEIITVEPVPDGGLMIDNGSDISIISAETLSDGTEDVSASVSPENTEAISDTVSTEGMSETDGPDDAAEVLEAADSMILEIEMADDPGYAAGETEESTETSETYAEETVTDFLEPTGDASCASYSRIRAFSLNTYENSYGEQLPDESAGIYQTMVNVWAAGKSDNLKHTFSSEYTFTTDGKIVDGAVQWDKENCDEYQDVLTEMRGTVQSAFDAFAYDYPEVFWLGKVTYTFSIGFSNHTDTQLTGHISSITICGTGSTREKYEGAASETGAFGAAVDAAVDQIRNSLPENADTWDTVKAIHDYICRTVSYGENEYAHTAAGVFHKENKVVVCEGYAKAMKILCGRFGIPSALIVGNALKSTGSREDHMWNYIRMDDGSWYMVDATWDDQSGGISYVYFLVGSSDQGFNAVISEERQLYTCFSNAAYTMSFTLPALSEKKYHHHIPGDWVIVKEATCTETGRRERYCTDAECGALIASESIELLAHVWIGEAVEKEATCITDGERIHTCSVCGMTETETIAAAGHSWNDGEITKEAACTAAGEKTYTCSVCGTTEPETIAALGHDYSTSWTVDKEATCREAGSKSHHCTRCGSKADVTGIAVIDHTWDSGTVTKDTTCTDAGVKTYTCTKCKATKTETIAATGHSMTYHKAVEASCTLAGTVEYWGCSKCKRNFSDETGSTEVSDLTIAATGHTWGSGTVTKAATCSAAGKKTYTCSVCGAVKSETIRALGKSSPTGHKWGTGKVTRAATCTAAGTKKYTCTDCGATKTTTIAKLGHKYSSYVTTRAATVLETGIKTSTCSRCGATKTKTIAKLKKTIKLNVSSLSLKVGQSTAAVKVTKMTAGDYVKSWKSGDTKIASVTKTGKITGKKAGTATITVTLASGAKATVRVTVKKTAVRTTKLSVTAKGAVLKDSKVTLKKSTRMNLIASVTPLTSSDKVTYSSSNTKVATVSAKGTVLAKNAGTAKITVKSGTKKVVITVKVPKVSTTAIGGIPAKLTIKKGKTVTLKPVITPSNSDDKVSFSTSKKSVAAISTAGKITAKKKGTAVITVKSGKVKVTCKVTVK